LLKALDHEDGDDTCLFWQLTQGRGFSGAQRLKECKHKEKHKNNPGAHVDVVGFRPGDCRVDEGYVRGARPSEAGSKRKNPNGRRPNPNSGDLAEAGGDAVRFKPLCWGDWALTISSLSTAVIWASNLGDLSAPLDLCLFEKSGRYRTAIDEREGLGTCLSCDWQASDLPGLHYVGDVRGILLSRHWRRVFMFAPCTKMTLSGSQQNQERVRSHEMFWAGALFIWAWCCCCHAIMAEHSRSYIATLWRKQSFSFHPYQFRSATRPPEVETKETWFWVDGYKGPIVPNSAPNPPYHARAHLASSSDEKSRSPWGMAEVITAQLSPENVTVDGRVRPHFEIEMLRFRDLYAERWGESTIPVGWNDPMASPDVSTAWHPASTRLLYDCDHPLGSQAVGSWPQRCAICFSEQGHTLCIGCMGPCCADCSVCACQDAAPAALSPVSLKTLPSRIARGPTSSRSDPANTQVATPAQGLLPTPAAACSRSPRSPTHCPPSQF
jgi:hypothetical protein